MRIFVSGPSGVGKSTIIKELLGSRQDIILSVSYTTRSPRPSEINGQDYFFISKSEFENMITRQAFLEWAHVHQDYYGTSLEWVSDMESKGYHILFDIDVQGVRQARAKGSDGCYIMIIPPDMDELEKRLKGRGTESSESLSVRLDNARKEISCNDMYDYIIINSTVEQAVNDFKTVINACSMTRKETLGRNEWLEKIK